MIMYCTLNGERLPINFKYTPWVPKKRVSVRDTYGGQVSQRNVNILPVADSISFTYQGDSNDWKQIEALYRLNVQMTFTGYWNESYEVWFDELDPPTVQGRVFDIAGRLRVACVNSNLSPDCGF